METVQGLLKKLQKELKTIQRSHSWVYMERKQNQYLTKIFAPHCSITHNSQDMETT